MTFAPRFGPRAAPGGGFEFRLWAPDASRVEVLTPKPAVMSRDREGWFRTVVRDARYGTRYRFRIDGALDVPDPASSFQPDDVFGPSEIVDHDHDWNCAGWRGRPWHEAVILELHVGTFTPGGTFRAAIERLDDVARTGFTAIELMPVADFFGARNWGYDGVLWFAPDSAYGTPEDLKALVDAAHGHGLMVFLDAVYNHFGPEGNFLPAYAPSFFTAERHTPWGAAIDYGVPEVRAFAIDNVLHWLSHYRFDGLRLDAVHAIAARGEPSILDEIAAAAGAFARESGRLIHLVVENDDNESHLLDSAAASSGKFRAQWNDDLHHAWHVLLTRESGGYYCDYADAPLAQIARALQSGFIYQGEASPHRGGRTRGQASGHLPPTAFVSFLQNHDQIGNRAAGDRLDTLAPAEAVEAALAVMLLAPPPPLMFMGEAWGETRPFPFFCDFRGDLADAVRQGRRREFREFLAQGVDVPDPLSEETFEAAKIDWSRAGGARHRLVQRLLAARHAHVVPLLARARGDAAVASACGTVLRADWRLGDGTLRLVANLGGTPADGPVPDGTVVWNDGTGGTLPPWSVFWRWER